jgi:hypothetical protein
MKKRINTFSEFQSKLLSDSVLQAEFKSDPVTAVQQFEQTSPIYTRDKWIYRMVVFVLGTTILSTVIGVILLMTNKQDISIDKFVPTMLTATCSAAIGALTGLLASPPRSNS